MSKRELTDWVTGYINYTKHTEPKKSFHNWMAIGCISSALQRKVKLLWGHEVIYPNMFIILVGPSGRARKGVAMSIAQNLLRDSGVVMTGEDITREQLIRKMKDNIQTFTDATTGKTMFHCSITGFAEELSVFLGINDSRFLSTLTNLYDARDEWSYETKRAGKDKIQGVCFTLIGATAPDWIPTMFPQEAIGGGFTSRCIFVVEPGKGQTISDHQITNEEIALRKALVTDLQRIANVTGQFKFCSQARRRYVSWYEQSEYDWEKGNPVIDDPRFEGYMARRPTHIRKLCMVMSASRDDSTIIEEEDFVRAEKLLSSIEGTMTQAFGGIGKSDYVEAAESILGIVQARKQISKSVLMRMVWRDVDSQAMKVVEDMMAQMKIVRIIRRPADGDTIYEWIGD